MLQHKMSELREYLEGPIELPLFSIRAHPIPPVMAEETGKSEARAPMRVDEGKAMELMKTLRDNLSRLTGKRAGGSSKGAVYSAKQVAEYAVQMGLPTAGRKKDDNVRAIKEKMREMGLITEVNL